MSNSNITFPASGETNSQWVDAITEATQKLSKNELAPHLHHHLFNLIDDCLDLGRDDILEQARNRASGLNLDDLLNDSINCAMETTLVKLNSGQIVESMLFAIPMVMYQARLGCWRSEFKQEIARQSGLVVWDLETPSGFTTDELCNRLMQCVSYFYEMLSDLEHKNTKSAMVSLHGDHGNATEIGIELFDRKLGLIDRHVWPFQVIDEIDLALENINSLLSRYPIKRVFPKALFPLVHSKTSDCKLTVIQ